MMQVIEIVNTNECRAKVHGYVYNVYYTLYITISSNQTSRLQTSLNNCSSYQYGTLGHLPIVQIPGK